MILDPMGGILLTNDGHAILREIDVAHPAAKSMIELSRTQDEEVGDGTTSVIILAGEILAHSLPLLERNIHPVVIIKAFSSVLETALETIQAISVPVNTSSDEEMMALVKTSIGTKFSSRWSDLMCSLALQAVRTVAESAQDDESAGSSDSTIKTVDLKRYARVEKIPGGEIEDCRVLRGVMLNKDVTHPKMRRRIANPRILLLDCPLEYKKGESQTNIEVSKEADWNRYLQIEEEQIKSLCEKITAFKPDLVFTEKGVSDLAQHYLLKADPPITAIRRVRKSDNNRIARAVGATIVNRVEDIRESDIGTQCGLFAIEKLGDEYYTFLTECTQPKACTILLRGPSKDILSEIDRNLTDAMSVARNVVFNPSLAPGGGATEMAISVALAQRAREMEGARGAPFRAVAEALEVVPRTLVQNCGGNVIRVLTELRVCISHSSLSLSSMTLSVLLAHFFHTHRLNTPMANTNSVSMARPVKSSICAHTASSNPLLSRSRRSRRQSNPPNYCFVLTISLVPSDLTKLPVEECKRWVERVRWRCLACRHWVTNYIDLSGVMGI